LAALSFFSPCILYAPFATGREAPLPEGARIVHGLLRLHAGAGDLAPLTTLMDSARVVDEDMRRLAEARAGGEGCRRWQHRIRSRPDHSSRHRLNQDAPVRRTLGYLPQEFGVYPKVSAEELLAIRQGLRF